MREVQKGTGVPAKEVRATKQGGARARGRAVPTDWPSGLYRLLLPRDPSAGLRKDEHLRRQLWAENRR